MICLMGLVGKSSNYYIDLELVLGYCLELI